VFVADPDSDQDEKAYMKLVKGSVKNLAMFIRVQSHDAKTIASVAQKYHITQIVIGESQRSRWKILLQGIFDSKLVQLLKHVDLHIM